MINYLRNERWMTWCLSKNMVNIKPFFNICIFVCLKLVVGMSIDLIEVWVFRFLSMSQYLNDLETYWYLHLTFPICRVYTVVNLVTHCGVCDVHTSHSSSVNQIRTTIHSNILKCVCMSVCLLNMLAKDYFHAYVFSNKASDY